MKHHSSPNGCLPSCPECSPLIDRLQTLKDARNRGDTALIQFKVDILVRARLLHKLKRDGLTQKDLFDSAIKIYLGKD